jgi:hypothetical protein
MKMEPPYDTFKITLKAPEILKGEQPAALVFDYGTIEETRREFTAGQRYLVAVQKTFDKPAITAIVEATKNNIAAARLAAAGAKESVVADALVTSPTKGK